jgi:hypothetical protein
MARVAMLGINIKLGYYRNRSYTEGKSSRDG